MKKDSMVGDIDKTLDIRKMQKRIKKISKEM